MSIIQYGYPARTLLFNHVSSISRLLVHAYFSELRASYGKRRSHSFNGFCVSGSKDFLIAKSVTYPTEARTSLPSISWALKLGINFRLIFVLLLFILIRALFQRSKELLFSFLIYVFSILSQKEGASYTFTTRLDGPIQFLSRQCFVLHEALFFQNYNAADVYCWDA